MITWYALCRWLTILVPAIMRCRHHHLLPRLRLLSSWQLLLRASGCSTKLCKQWHSRTRVVAMSAKAEKQTSTATSRNFRTLSRRFSTRPLNLWKPMNGSTHSRRSSVCWGWLKSWRRNMQHISWKAKKVFGGVITGPPCLPKLL